MSNNNKYSNTYTHGNVAYEIAPEIHVKKKKNTKKARKTQSSAKAKQKLKLLFGITAVAVLSFLVLCRYTIIMGMTSDVRKVKSEIKQVQKNNDNTIVEIAKYNNVKNIMQVAVEKHGMVSPEKDSIVYVDVKPLTLINEKTETSSVSFIQRVLGLMY